MGWFRDNEPATAEKPPTPEKSAAPETVSAHEPAQSTDGQMRPQQVPGDSSHNIFTLLKGTTRALENYTSARDKSVTFNVVLVGESGLGKTTAIKNLFGFNIARPGVIQERTLNIEMYRARGSSLVSNVELDLEVIDTPGYGDHTNINKSTNKISELLSERMRNHVFTKVDPLNNQRDNRVHLLLYFVAPHRFKDVDRDLILKLSRFSNVAVIAAKSDTMTECEVDSYKKIIKDVLNQQPQVRELRQVHPDLLHRGNFLYASDGRPFAVISEDRKYKFCNNKAECENPQHSDFPRLREEMIGRDLEQLKLKTDLIFRNLYNNGELRCPWYSARATYLGAGLGFLASEYFRQREILRDRKKGWSLGLVTGIISGAVWHTMFGKFN